MSYRSTLEEPADVGAFQPRRTLLALSTDAVSELGGDAVVTVSALATGVLITVKAIAVRSAPGP
jgi:hypothetical protein